MPIKGVRVLLVLLFFISCRNEKDHKIGSIQRVEEIVQSYADNLNFSGAVLVSHNDSIIYKAEYGFQDYKNRIKNEGHTKFRVASLSKQFTAAALLILEQNGEVDFDNPISTYLPQLKTEIASKVNIHHLLSHSSGLGRDIESLTNRNISQQFISIDEIIELINTSELLFKPGLKWSYSNLGYSVAAAIIEQVTSLDYGSAMDSLIFDPLKMTNTAHEVTDVFVSQKAVGHVGLPDKVVEAKFENKSYVIGGGSIYSTSEDLSLWTREVMKGNLISKHNLEKLFKKQAGRYSYGWYVSEYVWYPVTKKNKAINIYHDGGSPGFESKISILTEHDVSIIILSNRVPSYINELSNKITNTLLGFEDESNAKTNANIKYFNILYEHGIDSTLSLEASWKDEKMLHVPSKSEIYLIGRGYIDNKEYERANLIMDYLIYTSPEWTYPYLFKGIIMEELEEYEEAKTLYKKVLEIDGTQSNALDRLKNLN